MDDAMIPKAPTSERFLSPIWKRTLPIIFVFLFLTVTFLAVGWNVYRLQKERIKNHQHEMLTAVADNKVRQILFWRAERIEDAMTFVRNQAFSEEVLRFFNGEGRATRTVINSLAAFFQGGCYLSITLVDKNLNVRHAMGKQGEFYRRHAIHLIEDAKKKRQPIFSDLHVLEGSDLIHLDLVAPLFTYGGKSPTFAGAILFRIDPSSFLFPLIESWPMPSGSAETLLVRREGEDVVFLNELRHQKKTTLRLRRSIREPELPAAMAARGVEGLVEGKDYRGVPVLAVIRKVPDTPWYLIAKIDREEIYAPVRQLTITVSLVIGLLVLLSALIALFFFYGELQKTKRQEEKLQAEIGLHETRYRLIAENTADVVWVWDIDSRCFVYVSPSIFSLLGYTPEEIVGKEIEKLVSPETYLHLTHHLEERLKTFRNGNSVVKTSTRRHDLLTKNGQPVPVETVSTIMTDEEGNPKEIVGVTRDITEQTKLQKALEEERDRALLYLQAAGVMLVALDQRGKITLINSKGCEMLGYSEEELIGQDWFNLCIPEEERDKVKMVFEKLMDGEELPYEYFENSILTKDGKRKIVAFHNVLLRNQEGTVTGVLFSGEDITERRTAEEALKRLNEELELRIAQRTEELEAFTYSVSHDLRAPLRAINGFAQALFEDCGEQLDEKGKGYLKRIQEGGTRMSQIIDALLNLSRISRGNLTLSEVNLAEIARSIMKEIMEQEPSRKVNFLCPPRLTAWADARLIQIALTNLLHNAWKFTSLKEEAVIEVGERKEGREKVFFVRDNGAGFDMRYVNKLFSPFQRLHKAVEFPGIGIGLATVQRIIARHGGWIRAESTLNEGATFYFTLTKGG